MKYVDLNTSMTTPGGAVHGVVSPLAYLERLTEFADALPPGARAFAADPLHHDFHGPLCVKDLNLGEFKAPGDPAGTQKATIVFDIDTKRFWDLYVETIRNQ
ncbi:hypothetical protein [Streptosporangium sp. NPDC002721]|uniref:hypothetical protein n=1 Tax=Streptosporangium sp. NPDC002721 TaxID=3366188 RepID=UPI00367A529D